MTDREREQRNRAYMYMGIAAAALGLVAAGVGLRWISVHFGVSPWTALAEAMPLFLIVLAILGAGAVLSYAAARLAAGSGRRKGPAGAGD